MSQVASLIMEIYTVKENVVLNKIYKEKVEIFLNKWILNY